MVLGHRGYPSVCRRPLRPFPRFQRPLLLVGPPLEALQVAVLLRRLLRRSSALGKALQVRQNLAGRISYRKQAGMLYPSQRAACLQA